VQVMANVVAGVTLAFYHSWALALICLSTLPFTALGFWFQLQSLMGFSLEVCLRTAWHPIIPDHAPIDAVA